VSVKGERLRRRLSHRDARFLINIAELPPAAAVLDPFAGIGSIVLECRAHGVRVTCGDIEEALRPGLAQIAEGRAGILDAQRLPFARESFDAIITEPPYQRDDRAAVLRSIPELARVVVSGGCAALLVAEDMHEAVLGRAVAAGLTPAQEFNVRRQGKLRAKAQLLRKS
jgi:tRNA G10  N-methylase Trm11